MVSAIFAISSLLFLIGAALVPRRDECCNGYKIIIFSIMTGLCFTTLLSGVLSMAKIPISLFSTSIIVFLQAVYLWYRILKEKRVQKLKWPLVDTIGLFLILAMVLAVSIKVYTPSLEMNYLISDSGHHFRYAMDVVRSQSLDRNFFTPFVNAMFIEFFQPFIYEISAYKSFIIADITVHFFELCMIYLLLKELNRKKQWMNIVLTAAYFWGYPVYSYIGPAFSHWSYCIIIIAYVVLNLIYVEREVKPQLKYLLLMVLGVFGVAACYPFLTPEIFGGAFLVLVWIFRRKILDMPVKLKIISGVVTVLASGFALILVLQRTGTSLNAMFHNLQLWGGIYSSPYSELIFFVPVFAWLIAIACKKKQTEKTILILTGFTLLCTAVLFGFVCIGLISSYYYYKVYYMLWLLGWCAAAQLIMVLTEEKRLTGFMSYAFMLGLMAVICITGTDRRLEESKKFDITDNVPMNFFNLLRENMDLVSMEREPVCSQMEMDLYNRVLDDYAEEVVPMIVTEDRTINTYWYEGITGNISSRYYLWKRSIGDVIRRLKADKTKYIVVLKDSIFFGQYSTFIENMNCIWENEAGMILTYSGNSWDEFMKEDPDFTKNHKELYNYVKNNYDGKEVPILAEGEAQKQLIYYSIVTLQDPYEYFGWPVFDFVESTYELNKKNLEYALILKDTIMYEVNQDYFNQQEILFENEAGMLIHYSGTDWMP